MEIPTIKQLITNVAGKYLVSAGDNTVGINGFLFDIEVQEEVTIENEVTDHYVEGNYAVHDHVAKRAKMITLRGFIGELKDALNIPIGVAQAAQSLLDIGGLAPNFADQANQIYGKVFGVVSRIDSYINSINTLSDAFDNASSAKTEQQKALDKLTAFAGQSEGGEDTDPILCTVQTPFGIFKNMVIIRAMGIQREDTNIISDILVTLKQIRTVDVIYGDNKVLSGRANDALASVVEKGQVVGKTVDVSIFDDNWNLLP